MINRLMIIICIISFSCNTSNKHQTKKDNYSGKRDKTIKIHVPIKEVETHEVEDGKKAALVRESEIPDSNYFRFEEEYYASYTNGTIEIIRNDSIIRTFKLRTDLIVEKAYFYSYDNNLIVFFSDTDHDSGASFVECFEKPSYKSKWFNQLGSFNLAYPLIKKNLCYVSTLGFIGKLNLDNGDFFWKHEISYDTLKITSFRDPEFHEGKVNFIEEIEPLINKNKKPIKIIVDDKNGEIKGIIKNVP